MTTEKSTRSVKKVHEENPDSSEANEGEWVSKIKKMVKSEEMKLQEKFRVENEAVQKYLLKLKYVTDGLQRVNMSGNSFHFDNDRQVPYSGWRYLSGFLKKVDYVGRANQEEVASLREVYNKIGYTEEKVFALIRNPEDKSNIFQAAGPHRETMIRLSCQMIVSLKTCNRRRRKVINAKILEDLKRMCHNYKESVLKLDAECRQFENYKVNVQNNVNHYQDHIRKSLCITTDLSRQKGKIVGKELKKSAK